MREGKNASIPYYIAIIVITRELDSKHSTSISFYHNEADVIEVNILRNGSRIEGLVIYRCTYKKDYDWEEVMRRRHQVRKTLEYFDDLDKLDS